MTQANPAGLLGGTRPAAAARRRSRHRWLVHAAMLAVAVMLAAASASVEAAGGRPEPEATSLFHREDLGFTWQTVARIRDEAASIPSHVPEIVAAIRQHASTLGLTGSALVLVLLIAIAYGLFGRRRLARWADAQLSPLSESLPSAVRPWLSASISVAAGVLVPLALWLLHKFVAALTKFTVPEFMVLGTFLFAWMIYVLLRRSAYELLIGSLIGIAPEHGRYLYRAGKWLLIYAVVTIVVLRAAVEFGAPHDVVALFRWLFKLTLILLVALALVRRRAVMALFPDLPNRAYRAFVRGFDRLYPLILAFTLITALLQLHGFRELANFIWVRTWVVLAVFIGAVLLHHVLHVSLGRAILGPGPASKSARNFHRSATRLLDYIWVIAGVLIVLNITGLWRPLVGFLSVPFGKTGVGELSLLILIEAAAIVAAFMLAAILLRDYLEFQVYPRLGVDPGVTHAINTFLVYALTGIGVIAALEAVGLGLGAITLFAGAFGIGLGFGLQSLANNFASGLTLIFTRSLRKGDWVTVGDTLGVIQEVGIRATRLRTNDDVEYLIPNSEFINGKIVNWTRSSPYARLHLPIGVACDSDPERVKRILESTAARTPNVEQSPAPEARFVGFGESSLDFQLLVWINLPMVSRQKVTSNLYFAIFTAFKEAGIETPFPQRDLHIRSAEGLAVLNRKRSGESDSH